jgi:hypothetical protein
MFALQQPPSEPNSSVVFTPVSCLSHNMQQAPLAFVLGAVLGTSICAVSFLPSTARYSLYTLRIILPSIKSFLQYSVLLKALSLSFLQALLWASLDHGDNQSCSVCAASLLNMFVIWTPLLLLPFANICFAVDSTAIYSFLVLVSTTISCCMLLFSDDKFGIRQRSSVLKEAFLIIHQASFLSIQLCCLF